MSSKHAQSNSNYAPAVESAAQEIWSGRIQVQVWAEDFSTIPLWIEAPLGAKTGGDYLDMQGLLQC